MTVLSLTWESPYLGKTVFILRRGPDFVIIVFADGLAPYGARPSAGTVMIDSLDNFPSTFLGHQGFHIAFLDWITSFTMTDIMSQYQKFPHGISCWYQLTLWTSIIQTDSLWLNINCNFINKWNNNQGTFYRCFHEIIIIVYIMKLYWSLLYNETQWINSS